MSLPWPTLTSEEWIALVKEDLRTLGGPGSGNFGHAGRPGQVGGSSSSTSKSGSPGGESNSSLGASQRIERTRRRVEHVAEEMGFDASLIDIVDKEPRAFGVGNQEFKEAGHYNPRTGRIEINARNIDDDMMLPTIGVAAHEIFHAQWDAVQKLQKEEHEALSNFFNSDFVMKWRADGTIRPEHRAELEAKYPVSAALGEVFQDAYFNTNGPSKKMISENGHTSYAKAYWEKGAVDTIGGLDRAINEAGAEVTRLQVAPGVTPRRANAPSDTWIAFVTGVQDTYRKHVANNAVGTSK